MQAIAIPHLRWTTLLSLTGLLLTATALSAQQAERYAIPTTRSPSTTWPARCGSSRAAAT